MFSHLRVRYNMRSGILAASLAVLFILAAASTPTSSVAGNAAFFFFNSDGDLVRPAGYREWVYVGTPLTPNELNPPEAPFPEFHNVYIDPVSWAHYKATGEFRDGTILVKELVSVGSNVATSGNGFFMGNFSGLEATIKSSELFPDEPGYWAYFSFGHSLPLATTAEAFPTESCNGCHEVSAAEDFVFTQFYPVLRAASPTATAAGPEKMNEAARDTLMAAMSGATSIIREPRAATGTSPGPVPTDTDELFAYLVGREYESLASRESGLHPSRGPHTKFGNPVRVFMSDEIVASLEAGNASHPAGSSIVKELYLPDSSTLEGWAVMVKTQDETDDGNGWFWYEVVSTTDPTKLGGGEAGNGVRLCTGCHVSGRDYVLTAFPLE